jgi:hypothetical protein
MLHEMPVIVKYIIFISCLPTLFFSSLHVQGEVIYHSLSFEDVYQCNPLCFTCTSSTVLLAIHLNFSAIF